jgi:arylsulfatase A-like enzyme
MPSRPDPRPNIVFFMVDQLSARWLEAAWSGVCPTPNLDRLRRRGVTFTNAISSNPVCMPTRSTMATGLTTRGHGVLENGYELDPALPTFMQLLQEGGWRTGAFGKVHFRPHYAGLRPDYRPYGFDEVHNTEDSRGGEWLDWVETEHPDHYDAVLSTIWGTQIADFGAYGPDKIDLRPRIESAKAKLLPSVTDTKITWRVVYTLPFAEEVSQTAWITGHGVRFIRETAPDQPLFAQISYVQPHSPYCPPAEYLQYVDADRIPEPAPPEWLTDPHAPAYFTDTEGYFRPKAPVDVDWQKARHHYFADIVHLDSKLGEVFEALEETGRLDNTYIIFLSDHGDLLGDHGFMHKEERHYDACIRVPLIVAGPGLAHGLVCDQMVQHEDICPTVLDMAGLEMPLLPIMGPHLAEATMSQRHSLPGRSLLNLCRGDQPEDWRQAAYSESYNAIYSITPGDWARTIRTKDYRYTFYAHGNGEQMFDLRADPDEQVNIVADPSYATVRQGLRDQLLELIVMQDYPKTRRELFALGVH